MGDVTVVIGTFGDPDWIALAHDRAIPSVAGQAPVIHEHADTLAQARNRALDKVRTQWVVHLDADDELTPGYVEAMFTGTADLRAPSLQQVRPRRRPRHLTPRVWGHEHDCAGECLPEGNFIVVGAMVRTRLVRDVGAWRDFDWSEDWDLWLRCHLAGATIETIPQAIYRAWFRPDSRNHAPSAEEKAYWHRAIYDANFPAHAA